MQRDNCRGEASFGTVEYANSTVKEQGWAQSKYHFVNCIQCSVKNVGLVGFATQEKAAEAWNRRAMPPEVRELKARTESLLKDIPPCTCIDAFRSRYLTDPECPFCNYFASEDIEALKKNLAAVEGIYAK